MLQVQASDADLLRKQQAAREELKHRRTIEEAGWRVSRVSIRNGRSHYAIVQGEDRKWYGTPKELAQRVQKAKPERQLPHRQRRRAIMAGTNDEKNSPGFGAKTGSTPNGGDSRSPLEKRGGTKIESGGSKEK